jgi:putative membrane protein
MLKPLFASTPRSTRHPIAAILAGSIGGAVSGYFKLGWEVLWPPRALGRIPEPQVLVTLFTHHPTPNWVSLIIHFTFSILCGAAYGILAEIFPIVAIGTGVAFGLAIWIGAHELIMPWIGLTPAAWLLPASEQGSEFFGHALWGWVIAVFYEDLRRRFIKQKASTAAE